MNHSVSHSLDKALAVKAARAALEAYATRFPHYSPSAQWIADDRADVAFSVKGVRLTGSLAVTASSIDLALDVPLLLRAFRTVAVSTIDREINHWLAKAERGDFS